MQEGETESGIWVKGFFGGFFWMAAETEANTMFGLGFFFPLFVLFVKVDSQSGSEGAADPPREEQDFNN